MNEHATSLKSSVETPPQVYNDSRFDLIIENAREITRMSAELNEMSHHKLGQLLGDSRGDEIEKPIIEAVCWVDVVAREQQLAMDLIQGTLSRIDNF